MLANGDLERAEDQEHAALQIVGSGQCEAVVVSPGLLASCFPPAQAANEIPSPAVTACSKVGAGDSLVAGIALALARDGSQRDAVRFGVATGAAEVMNPGTKLCNRADAEHLFAQIG